MRYARIKPDGSHSFMHIYNRTAGCPGQFPFGKVEKEEFIRRIHLVSQLYIIEPIAYQVMGNHYHLIVYVPSEPLSLEETASRYNAFYKGKKPPIHPDSPQCAAMAPKLRDISEFMRAVQQPFTRWFNRTRAKRRRGHLWADRFKNTILESGLAVWSCWKYIEMNPVRAHMVTEPEDYRFCSFAHWSATGTHPFKEAVKERLMPIFEGILHVSDMEALRTEMKKDFAYYTALEANETPRQADAAIAGAAEREAFSTRLDRRVRYWADGLVIGSELFVRNIVARSRTGYKMKKRRLTRAMNRSMGREALYSFKQLRVLVD